MDFNKLNIKLVRDYNKEYFYLPTNAYLEFAPVNEKEKGRYLDVNLRKKDALGYIVNKKNDTWLYRKHGHVVFLPLHKTEDRFSLNQPLVCWIEYMREPTFIIYISAGYGVKGSYYMIYKEDDKKNPIVNWTFDINEASVFSQIPLDWKSTLSENVDYGGDYYFKKYT